jgi:hypothetical protein
MHADGVPPPGRIAACRALEAVATTPVREDPITASSADRSPMTGVHDLGCLGSLFTDADLHVATPGRSSTWTGSCTMMIYVAGFHLPETG